MSENEDQQNKIIQLAPGTKPEEVLAPKPAGLSREEAFRLGGALHRVFELSRNRILSSTDAAERRGLEQYIADTLVANANELLGAWFTVRNEYEPALRVIASVTNRVRSIFSAAEQMAQSQAEPEGPSASPARE